MAERWYVEPAVRWDGQEHRFELDLPPGLAALATKLHPLPRGGVFLVEFSRNLTGVERSALRRERHQPEEEARPPRPTRWQRHSGSAL